MYAAPTASEDFEILISFQQKIWKDKISFIDNLIEQLQHEPNPEKIQICFLEMMKNTSVNIIKKVIKLIHKYIVLYGIKILSQRELSQCLLNASLVDVEVETVVKELFLSARNQEERELILEGMKNFCDGSREKNNILIIEIYSQLLPIISLKQLCYFHHLEDCLTQLMYNLNEEVENALQHFFKFLFENIGPNAILLMRKTGYPFVQKITKANIKANSNFESVENANFEYVYMLGSESWFEDYFYIPIKCINSSLKFAEKEIEEGTLNTELTQQLIVSWTFLAKKKNNTINKSIYQIMIKILNRDFTKQNSKQLFELLYELLSNKRIVKRILEENKVMKQQIWLSTITSQNISIKVKESALQQEYHRLILLLNFYKKQNNETLKNQVEELKRKNNLSHVYKVQLDHLYKENNQQKQN